jgi:ATP-dependent RNA helicase SUPV3L1/SUV3
LQHLPKEARPFLRKLGVTFGALDIFAAPLLKPAPRRLLHALGLDLRPLNEAMLSVLSEESWPKGRLPAGYRLAGTQAIRVDLAEKIFRAAFDARAAKPGAPHFRLDLALPISIGLVEENARRLLGSAGFRVDRARALAEGAHGPPAPDRWTWRPRRDNASSVGAGRHAPPGERNEARGKPQGKAKAGGKPQRQPNGKPHAKSLQRQPAPRQVKTGPARAGGAFDALADLLRR